MWYGFDDVKKLAKPNSKVCIVTGGNSGVGLICVRELYRAGWKVIFTVRNEAAGQATITRVQREVGKEGGVGTLYAELLDLSEQENVKNFAQKVQKAHPVIHVLLNNAAVGPENRFRLTSDGEEYTWATNHLGHYQLTHLLLPNLLASGEARIVNVASGNLTKACKDPFAVFDADKRRSKSWYGFNGAGAYKRSKICNVWFTDMLAQKIEEAKEKRVTAHCVNPGKHGDSKILSHSFQNMSWFNFLTVGWFLWLRYRWNPPSVELAALNMLHVCTEPSYAEKRGRYISSRKDPKTQKVEPFEDKIPAQLDKETYMTQLWTLSYKLTGLDFFAKKS